MKRTFRRNHGMIAVLIAVLIIVTVGSAFAAGQKDGATAAKPQIRVAHLFSGGVAGSYNEYFQSELTKFAAANSNLADYVFEAEQGDNLRNKIKLDLAANNLPDVFYYWSITSLQPMIDGGLLANVKDYVDASTKVKWTDFFQSGWNAYTKDGKSFWAVPDSGFKDYFLVNKDLFAKYNLQYPKTFDDLMKVSKVFNDNGIIPIAVGSKGGNPSHFFFGELYYQIGSLQYMEGVTTGQNSFNTPLIVQTAQRVLDMAKAGVFPKDTIGNGDFAPAVALYNDEKAAMILGQTWSIKNFKPEIAAKSDFITFPKIQGAVNDPSTFTVGNVNNGWVITKKGWDNQAKRPGIIALMDHLLSDEAVAAHAASGSLVYKDVKLDPATVPPLYSRMLAFTGKQDSWTNFWSLMPDPVSQEVLSTTLDELWAQSISAQGFVDKVTASIQKALK